MTLKSPKVTISKSPKTLFTFLSNIKHFRALMPEADLRMFEITDSDTLRFALRGMPEIELKEKSTTPYSDIVLETTGAEINALLTFHITESSDAYASDVQLVFSGSLNVMMTMMAKGPIRAFIETLVNNIPNAINTTV